MAEDTNATVTTAPTTTTTTTTTLEEAVKNNKAENKIETQKNRIQVSNTKKPLFFYLNLAKRYIKQHDDVELSALGMAIPTVVIIAEILKRNGLATEKKVLTSTVGSKDEVKGRLVQKAKIEIVLVRTENGVKPKNDSATAPKKNADNTVVEATPNGTAAAEAKKDADKE